MKKIKVLHLLSQTELTGSEVFAFEVIQKQVLKNFEVFALSDDFHLPFSCTKERLSFSKKGWINKIKVFFQLRKFILKHHIDIIHCHSRGVSRHAFWARLGTKAKLLTTLHGRQHFSFSKKLFNSYGAIVLSICENLKKSLVQDFKMDSHSIHIVRNGFDLERFPYKKRTSINKILMVTRGSGPKGLLLERLLPLFKAFLKRHPTIHFQLICSQVNQLSESAQKLIKQLHYDFPKQFDLEEHAQDLPSAYQKSDLVIGGGRVAIESLLSGSYTFAMGEYSFLGLINLDNYTESKKSNFGDIGWDNREEIFEPAFFFQQLEKVITESQSTRFSSTTESLSNFARQDYNIDLTIKKMDWIYHLLLFSRQYDRWIPTLMYHKITDQDLNSKHKIYLQKNIFEKHCQFFKAQGFETLYFSDLKKYILNPDLAFPKKPLILTFDDGYQDNLINAAPLLEKYGLKANLFLLSDNRIVQNTWDSDDPEGQVPLLSPQERKKISRENFEIGSHGKAHADLTKLSDQEVFEEMQISQDHLSKELDIPIPVAFAYPFGYTNDQVSQLLSSSGYSFGLNTDQGAKRFFQNPFSIFRVNIFPTDGIPQLRKKTNPWYRTYFYFKRRR